MKEKIDYRKKMLEATGKVGKEIMVRALELSNETVAKPWVDYEGRIVVVKVLLISPDEKEVIVIKRRRFSGQLDPVHTEVQITGFSTIGATGSFEQTWRLGYYPEQLNGPDVSITPAPYSSRNISSQPEKLQAVVDSLNNWDIVNS